MGPAFLASACVTTAMVVGTLGLTPANAGGAATAAMAAKAKNPCAAGTTVGSTIQIALRASLDNSLTVPVCINGKGPLRFLVDTGADSTAITTSAANRVGLQAGSSSGEFFGVGRPLQGSPIHLSHWTVGAVSLAPQTVFEASLKLGSGIDGLLGSDVLSRFGVIRLDYNLGVLVLNGKEGPVLTKQQIVQGHVGEQLPAAFARYQPQDVLPLAVLDAQGSAVAVATVTIGTHTVRLELDSGSAISTLSPSQVAKAGLVPQHKKFSVEGIGGTVKAPIEGVGAWELGTVKLVPEGLAELSLPGQLGNIQGLLGADVLSQFGAVTLDYTDGTLAIDQEPVV